MDPHTPKLSTMLPFLPKKRKSIAQVRTFRCTLPMTCVKCGASGLLIISVQLTPNLVQGIQTFQRCGKNGTHGCECRCIPPLVFVKCLADRAPTTHQISAQSVRPSSRFEKRARLHVGTCVFAYTFIRLIIYAMCITIWSLNTRQL